eukprot:3594605-Heterocapsa_arctica.AAC.1
MGSPAIQVPACGGTVVSNTANTQHASHQRLAVHEHVNQDARLGIQEEDLGLVIHIACWRSHLPASRSASPPRAAWEIAGVTAFRAAGLGA